MRGAWAILRTVDLKEVKQRSYMVMVCFREAPPETFGGVRRGRWGLGENQGDTFQVREEEVLSPPRRV